MRPYIFIATIIAAFTFMTSCSPKSESSLPREKEEKPVAVDVMEIMARDLPLVVESVGRLIPNREVTLSAEVGGIVDSYHADTGDRVERDQILLRIDPTDYLLGVKEAEANLEVTLAGLEGSEKAFVRLKKLLPEKVITHDVFERSEADFKSARASVARAGVLLDIANERLSKTSIIAPFSGLIASRNAEKGQNIGTGQALMTLVDLDPMRVKVYLTEMDYMALDRDDPVEVTLETSPELIFNGRVDRIGIKADAGTNTFDVEILVDNHDFIIKAGMTSRVRITTSVIKNAIMIPQSAVLYRKDRREVYVADQNQEAEARIVEMGRREGSLIRILKGLMPGDRLILSGAQYLKPGDKVIVSSSQQAHIL